MLIALSDQEHIIAKTGIVRNRRNIEKFANGLITRLELKEAEIRLNSARIGYLTAVFNYVQALYDLLNAVGLYELDETMVRS